MSRPNAASLDWCAKCCEDTPTVLAPMDCGHIGRLCSICRSLRHPHPWASKAEYQRSLNPPAPTRAEGFHHGRASR